MKKSPVNIALIGSGFMGRAHSNGLRQARSFFDLPVEPELKVLCARNPRSGERVAQAFGWKELVSDWREVVERPDIQVVDIATPVDLHKEIALAALAAGKAVICEKPLAGNLVEAREMAAAARRAGALNLCNYNWRGVPAIVQARRMIEEGKVGAIHQWRAAFLQAWLVNPNFPLTWRLQKERAGSGALGDIGSHSLDLARLLVGEIQAVNAMLHTFTRQRPFPLQDIGRASQPSDKMGTVTVDDAAWALLRFESGALGSMEASRMATGQLCANRFELYGSRGALAFDFMRLNELEYFSLDDAPAEQGWRTIHVTAPEHPYISAWWPKGHSLGYEHSFANLFADFFRAYAAGEAIAPDFADAARTQAVLEAVERSAAEGIWVSVEM